MKLTRKMLRAGVSALREFSDAERVSASPKIIAAVVNAVLYADEPEVTAVMLEAGASCFCEKDDPSWDMDEELEAAFLAMFKLWTSA